jgi:uncharacterized membrane protein YkvA (DUF1232 family)
MNILPDNILVLVTCLLILAICIFIIVAVFKIALKIRSLKIKFAAMGLSALYVLSPFDLIPDLIPVLGQIDDAAALAAFIGLVLSVYADCKKKNEK